MIRRKPVAPNNLMGTPIENLKGRQFASIKYPKNIETTTTATWSSPGKGAQGESVTGGTYRANIIRKHRNTRG